MRQLCLLSALVVLVVANREVEVDSAVDLGVESLGESNSLATGLFDRPEMTLGEIQDAAAGVRAMSAAERIVMKHKFTKLAVSMKNPELRESVLAMTQMVQDESAPAPAPAPGGAPKDDENNSGGMKLVYKKLDELRHKTTKEGEEDDKQMRLERDDCAKTQAEASSMIEAASSTTAKNSAQAKQDQMDINKIRVEVASLVEQSAEVYQEFLTIEPDRETIIAETAERCDERAKGLDVITKATFVVCEKFRQFKNTAQCMAIKSMPDVEEPKPDELRGKDQLDADIQSTKEFEKVEEENFAKLAESDAAKVGVENPEGLGGAAAGAVDTDGTKEVQELGETLEDSPLDATERPALRTMEELASTRKLQSKLSTPLVELVIALKKGKRRKALNIVQVLINVRKTIHEEQIEDKMTLHRTLEELYERAWAIQSELNAQRTSQGGFEGQAEEARQRILSLMEDNELQRQSLKNQRKIKLNEEERCATTMADYGLRVSVRDEDLENLSKLKSLLRALYQKQMPTECKEGAMIKQRCSGEDHGWCVFDDVKGPEQHCSCNYGYYGETCEFTMCPGLGHVSHKADSPAVCSERGTCSRLTGLCESCGDGFYHGTKQACELKHCPASIGAEGTEPVVDEKCSGHGECDTKRGVCNCPYEWSGDSCQNMKCPNSNSVLYPIESANACNGRGACDVKTGTCSCEAPYSGKTCELQACERECSARGGCDTATGKCFCNKPFEGKVCNQIQCKDDCNDGGWCDRISGKCLCKKGFSGETCLTSTRCSNLENSTPQANWYTMWDKPGWIVCPDTQVLFAIERSGCNALSCLNSGKCATPCEGDGDLAIPLKLRHCYHNMDTYTDFDQEGWAKCDPNYYVAGMYRSCDSLYCLNMLKCCNFKLEEPTRSIDCEELNWAAAFDQRGMVEAPEKKFITGFYRGKEHTLSNIDKAEACGWTRGY
jgi:hypothetical protein